MSAALGLLRLQQVDSNLDHVEAELAELGAAIENNTELDAAKHALQVARDHLGRQEADRSAAEQQANAQRTKLNQAEASLYGGTVRNPKELQDLQAEVSALKRRLDVLDEEEVARMQELESAEAELSAANASMNETLARVEKTKGELLSRQSELMRVRSSLLVEKAAAAPAIPSDWQALYQELRRSHRGLAVASIDDGTCTACGTALTAMLQQTARHSADVVLCPSCGRILYAD